MNVMTSQIAGNWTLCSIQVNNKENIALLDWHLCKGDPPVTDGFPSQSSSNVKSVSISYHRSPVNSPHKGQWRGALMLSFIRAWINGWVKNRQACDLRRHRAHYDVIVMKILILYLPLFLFPPINVQWGKTPQNWTLLSLAKTLPGVM